MTKLKPGQSQLDWLWTHYGGLEISDSISSDKLNGLVTTQVLIDYVQSELKKLNTDVNLSVVKTDDLITLRIKDHQGTIISETSFERGAKITKFEKFISTQEDVDKGHSSKVGCLCLALQDSLGQEYYIDITELNYSGQETDSIVTAIKDYKIASSLKINNPILDKSVDIRKTPDGIRADIVINPNSNSAISIETGEAGISCHYKWEGETTELKFRALTYSEYTLISKKDFGTLYFITDLPCIYFRKIKYASSTELMDYMTRDEAKELFEQYNKDILNNIDKLNTRVIELKSYVDSDRERIAKLEVITNNTVATLNKLEGDENTLGSVLNIVTNKLNDTLSWEILK